MFWSDCIKVVWTFWSRLTVICLLMISILKCFLQLLCLAPQTEALEHLSSTVPLLLAAVLFYHLFLDVLKLFIAEVLHEHRLKHLQRISLVYRQHTASQFTGLWTNMYLKACFMFLLLSYMTTLSYPFFGNQLMRRHLHNNNRKKEMWPSFTSSSSFMWGRKSCVKASSLSFSWWA